MVRLNPIPLCLSIHIVRCGAWEGGLSQRGARSDWRIWRIQSYFHLLLFSPKHILPRITKILTPVWTFSPTSAIALLASSADLSLSITNGVENRKKRKTFSVRRSNSSNPEWEWREEKPLRQIDPTPCHSPVKSRIAPWECEPHATATTNAMCSNEKEGSGDMATLCFISSGLLFSWERSIDRTRKSNFWLSSPLWARGWWWWPWGPSRGDWRKKGTGRRTDKGWREIKRPTDGKEEEGHIGSPIYEVHKNFIFEHPSNRYIQIYMILCIYFFWGGETHFFVTPTSNVISESPVAPGTKI